MRGSNPPSIIVFGSKTQFYKQKTKHFFYSKKKNRKFLKKEKTELKREHAAEEHLGTHVRRAASHRSREHARGHTQGRARTCDYSSV